MNTTLSEDVWGALAHAYAAVAAAGVVGFVLVVLAAALGAVLVYRALALTLAPTVRELVAGVRPFQPLTWIAGGDDADRAREQVDAGAALARTLVMIAPLLGLLGTVIGMIDTFSALTDVEVFSRADGMSKGVSQALLTTQLGLVVAIPGLLMSRFLDRKAKTYTEDIDAAMQRALDDAQGAPS